MLKYKEPLMEYLYAWAISEKEDTLYILVDHNFPQCSEKFVMSLNKIKYIKEIQNIPREENLVFHDFSNDSLITMQSTT